MVCGCSAFCCLELFRFGLSFLTRTLWEWFIIVDVFLCCYLCFRRRRVRGARVRIVNRVVGSGIVVEVF